MFRISILRIFVLICLLSAQVTLAWAAPSRTAPLVLAAASMQESLNAAADSWVIAGHPRPILSFAASSALARQIAAGGPADLFISADEEWMDAVQRRGLLAPRSRADLVANALVLIAPKGSAMRIRIGKNMPLARSLGSSRLAMADPDSVPAGKYGKAALTMLGVWPSVANKVARAENVRAALALVERGEAPLGIVYATDARASSKVMVVGTFPAASHPPIRYPIARLARSTNPEAEEFRRFLLSASGKAIFARFGFVAR
ncbi:molybdate ABC transporter substrate-binding protein [Sphingobium aromaticiconvertens]|uniref:molybdate ABC transporter substrate-binding protein n=1 Tax=Sphingobium aromaticiconvertens TaxID=365341 RepID=UPI00301B00C9